MRQSVRFTEHKLLTQYHDVLGKNREQEPNPCSQEAQSRMRLMVLHSAGPAGRAGQKRLEHRPGDFGIPALTDTERETPRSDVACPGPHRGTGVGRDANSGHLTQRPGSVPPNGLGHQYQDARSGAELTGSGTGKPSGDSMKAAVPGRTSAIHVREGLEGRRVKIGSPSRGPLNELI